jgi:hypothetical protein
MKGNVGSQFEGCQNKKWFICPLIELFLRNDLSAPYFRSPERNSSLLAKVELCQGENFSFFVTNPLVK